MPYVVLVFILCSTMILAIGTVPPVVLYWVDRRLGNEPLPLPMAFRVLAGVACVLMAIFAIVYVGTAHQERACKAEGGTSYSLIRGCS
jgi:hypothetical protein